nr:MAG TPA: hypothetical protein [Caudoviricetes sp.]
MGVPLLREGRVSVMGAPSLATPPPLVWPTPLFVCTPPGLASIQYVGIH